MKIISPVKRQREKWTIKVRHDISLRIIYFDWSYWKGPLLLLPLCQSTISIFYRILPNGSVAQQGSPWTLDRNDFIYQPFQTFKTTWHFVSSITPFYYSCHSKILSLNIIDYVSMHESRNDLTLSPHDTGDKLAAMPARILKMSIWWSLPNWQGRSSWPGHVSAWCL